MQATPVAANGNSSSSLKQNFLSNYSQPKPQKSRKLYGIGRKSHEIRDAVIAKNPSSNIGIFGFGKQNAAKLLEKSPEQKRHTSINPDRNQPKNGISNFNTSTSVDKFIFKKVSQPDQKYGSVRKLG